MGLMMYGQMTAGSWIYIATQGILQGTYETFAAMADRHFGGTLRGTITVTAGLGGISGAQPLAVTMNDGLCLAIELIDEQVKQKMREDYVDEQARDLTHALEICERAKADGTGWSVGLTGNAVTVLPQLLERGFRADIVTDQTSAHDLMDYLPEGDINAVLGLRKANPQKFTSSACRPACAGWATASARSSASSSTTSWRGAKSRPPSSSAATTSTAAPWPRPTAKPKA